MQKGKPDENTEDSGTEPANAYGPDLYDRRIRATVQPAADQGCTVYPEAPVGKAHPSAFRSLRLRQNHLSPADRAAAGGMGLRRYGTVHGQLLSAGVGNSPGAERARGHRL